MLNADFICISTIRAVSSEMREYENENAQQKVCVFILIYRSPSPK